MFDQNRPPVAHVLKTVSPWYDKVIAGEKPIEIRKADRDFRVGDVLVLYHYDFDTDSYLGSYCVGVVGDVWENVPGVQKNYVVIKLLSEFITRHERGSRFYDEDYDEYEDDEMSSETALEIITNIMEGENN